MSDFEHKFKDIVNKGLKEGGFPSATSSNSMTIPEKPLIYGFRPNNYRLGIEFNYPSDSGSSRNKGTILSFPLENPLIRSKLLFIKEGPITLQIGKSKIIAIYDQKRHLGKKFWYRIERNSLEEIDKVIESKKEEIKSLLIDSIKAFALKNNLKLINDFFWVRAESGIKGDSFLDSLPQDLIIHDTTFRKVYKDETEFISGKNIDPIASIKNYINNRSLEDFMPELSHQINLINHRLDIHEERALIPLTHQIELHLEVMKNINEGISDLRKELSRFRESSPPHNSFSPETFSKDQYKEFKLLRARKILNEWGWSESKW